MLHFDLFKKWLTKLNPKHDSMLVDGIFSNIVQQYTQAHRFYHNLAHVESCLKELNNLNILKGERGCLTLAILYHDIIYVPGSKFNEVMSADIAKFDCSRLGLSEDLIVTIYTLILASRHDRKNKYKNSQIMCDIDLSILAAEDEEYKRYEIGISKEFIPVYYHSRYLEGRISFLQNILNQDKIFQHSLFANREQKARENVAKAIACLKRGDLDLVSWGQ